MRDAVTFRGLMNWALMLGLLTGVSGAACAQRWGSPGGRRAPGYAMAYAAQSRGYGGQQQRPAPIVRRPPPGAMGSGVARRPGAGPGQGHLVGPNGQRGGEHLAEWMNQHSGMTVGQQQQALDREPGFRSLPVETQQRMHERLAQLNAMSPMQRERLLAHTEAMERLNPEQRSVVRGAMQQLGSLPMDQRLQVARSFREIRMLPPEERIGAMNSPRYGWLNYEQRVTLANLIRIAPMLPPQ